MMSADIESNGSRIAVIEEPVRLLQHDLGPVSLHSLFESGALDNIEYPGINPRIRINGNYKSTRTIGWHEIGQYDSEEDIRVTTGKLGALTCILDPRTNRPVTPGCHQIDILADKFAVLRIGSGYYELAANTDLEPHSYVARPAILRKYPNFLLAEKIRVRKLDSLNNRPTTTCSPLATKNDNPFGLEKPVDKIALLGQQVFESALRGMVHYASHNKKTLTQLQDPEATVLLPEVNTPELSAHLRFNSYHNGNNSFHLSGADDKGGFILIEDPSGNVTIMDSSLSKVTGRDDHEYTEYLGIAKKYLDMYYAALSIKTSAENLSGENMFDIRLQLGEMSTRAARKSLKKASQA